MSRSLFFLSLFFFLCRGEESLLFPLERRRGRTQTPCARVAHANAAVGVRFLPGQTETRLWAAAAAGSARGAGEDPAAAASGSGLFVWKRRWRTRLSEAGDSGRLSRGRVSERWRLPAPGLLLSARAPLQFPAGLGSVRLSAREPSTEPF